NWYVFLNLQKHQVIVAYIHPSLSDQPLCSPDVIVSPFQDTTWSTSCISSLVMRFSISTKISIRSSRVPMPVRYSVENAVPKLGAALICEGCSIKTSDTPSTTIPTTRDSRLRITTTVSLLYSTESRLNLMRI